MVSKNNSSVQKVDENIKDVFLKAGKDRAPADFTQNLIERIESEIQIKQLSYTPVIPKWIWGLISFIVIVMLVISGLYSSSTAGGGIFHKITEVVELGKYAEWVPELTKQVVEILLSSEIILSLVAVFGIGTIHYFIHQKLEVLR